MALSAIRNLYNKHSSRTGDLQDALDIIAKTVQIEINHDLRRLFRGRRRDFCVEAYTCIANTPVFVIYVPNKSVQNGLSRRLKQYTQKIPFDTHVFYL